MGGAYIFMDKLEHGTVMVLCAISMFLLSQEYRN